MDFIKIKRDLTQVTGANISIKLNKEFMEAVQGDVDYILKFPCDTNDWDIDFAVTFEIPYNKLITTDIGEIKYIKKIRAREYWNEIIKSAHNVAEPGLMFWNNMINYSPDSVYPQYRPITTNPCSEIAMQEFDACRLIAVNLFSFVKNPFTKKAEFDFDKFYQINYEAMRLSDDLIDLEIEHIDRILEKLKLDPQDVEVKYREIRLWNKVKETAQASRRTGLGFTALADTLAALGLKYDSNESLDMIEKIMHKKMESELDCTIDLAILRGTFEGWDVDLEYKEITGIHGQNEFYDFIAKQFPNQTKRMIEHGRRNVSWSTIAPTGTVSLMSQTTSGIEPLFMPFYIRRKKVNPGEEGTRVDFVDDNGDSWQEFPVLHPKFKDWINANFDNLGMSGFENIEELSKDELQKYFEYSPWYGSTANDINWINRVKLQGIIQQYITHSISSTINLPSNVSEEEVSKIYMESWKAGLKGITVYRDGSRSGVLITESITDNKHQYRDAIKRNKSLPVDIHSTISKGIKWNVIIGLKDNLPYEVFALPQVTVKTMGQLIKINKGRYDLYDGDILVKEDITSSMNDEQEVITRLISTSLRHGTDIKFIVEQLNKSYGDITSFSKAIARILKKYIPDGAKSTVTCNDCGSNNVIFEEGCNKCLDCGSTKCG